MNRISSAVPLTAFALVSVFHLWACLSGKQRARHISKGFLLPLLAVSYLALTDAPAPLALLAFGFGWLGDLFLISPGKDLPRTLGIASFVAGHFCYFALLVCRLSAAALTDLVWLPPAVFLILAAVLYSRIFPVLPKNMRVLSFFYFLILAVLGSLSGLSLLSAIPRSGFLVAGAVFFLCSDTILCRQFYTVGDPAPKTDFAVMLTYLLAQFFLMLGFAL